MEKELWYKRNSQTDDSSNKIRYHLWKLVDSYLFKTSPNLFSRWRIFLLKCFGAEIGVKCYISPRVVITKPWEFKMGNVSSIDDYCYIVPPVIIKDYVSIGNNTHIIGGGHDIWSRGFEVSSNAVIIDNGAFIGAGCSILPGSKIGEMSVIDSHIKVQGHIRNNTVVIEKNNKIIKCDRLPEEEYNKYRYHYIGK